MDAAMQKMLPDPTKEHPHAEVLAQATVLEPDDLKEAFALGRKAARAGDGLASFPTQIADIYNRGYGFESGLRADGPPTQGWMGVPPQVYEAYLIGWMQA